MNKFEREVAGEVGGIKYAIIRRDPASYIVDLPEWFKKLSIQEIVSVCQTESNGNITISLFYR